MMNDLMPEAPAIERTAAYTLRRDWTGGLILIRRADGHSVYFEGDDAREAESRVDRIRANFGPDDQMHARMFDAWASEYEFQA
jgi:hypothetical protein